MGGNGSGRFPGGATNAVESAQVRDSALWLYRDGLVYQEIAALLPCSPRSVAQWVIRAGINRRRGPRFPWPRQWR